MSLSVPVILIIAGIVIWVAFSPLLGGLLALVGLVLLLVPYLRGGSTGGRRA